jgi:BON domain
VSHPPEPDEPPQYVVARVKDALANDPRGGELDIRVKIAGAGVFLSGSVSTPARRDAIATVVGELLPEYELHNAITVTDMTEDPAPERIE